MGTTYPPTLLLLECYRFVRVGGTEQSKLLALYPPFAGRQEHDLGGAAMNLLASVCASAFLAATLSGCGGGLSAECERLVNVAASNAKSLQSHPEKEKALRAQQAAGEITFEEMQQGISQLRDLRMIQGDRITDLLERCGDHALKQLVTRSNQ